MMKSLKLRKKSAKKEKLDTQILEPSSLFDHVSDESSSPISIEPSPVEPMNLPDTTIASEVDGIFSAKPPVRNELNKRALLYLGLILLGLVAAAYMWMQNQSTPVPQPVAKPVVKPKTNPAPPVMENPAITVAPTPASTATATVTASAVAIDEAVSQNEAPQGAKITPSVTPEQILTPALPQDPAIAQEEIDRLNDQHQQLAEQEKVIDEQLAMINELSSKKEERIKLLEQQLAQLEQQKSGQATPAKP